MMKRDSGIITITTANDEGVQASPYLTCNLFYLQAGKPLGECNAMPAVGGPRHHVRLTGCPRLGLPVCLQLLPMVQLAHVLLQMSAGHRPLHAIRQSSRCGRRWCHLDFLWPCLLPPHKGLTFWPFTPLDF